jgi:TRAP-type C4-dicarboxylate transport system permease small subunit
MGRPGVRRLRRNGEPGHRGRPCVDPEDGCAVSTETSKPRRDPLAAFSRAYAGLVVILACVMMLLIVSIMGVQVFYRYVLNDSLIWAEEICRYLLVLMTFLLIGAAFERGEMVCLQFLTGRLTIRARLAIMLPMHLLMTVFLLTLAYYGYGFAKLNSQFTVPAIDFIGSALLGREVNLAVSMYWMYMLVPAACVILSAHLVVSMIRMARGLLGYTDAEAALPPGHNTIPRDWIG